MSNKDLTAETKQKATIKFLPLDGLIKSVKELPKENFFYEGIKENSLNLLIAQAKVGKTTWAENLAMCIAAGHNKYLDKKVWFGENRIVLLFSLEEFFRGRTERNIKQVKYMDTLVGNDNWHENVYASPTDVPRYIENREDWEWMLAQIKEMKPAFTVIDSLSRMHGSEAIEDSSTCNALMKKLKNIVYETGTTLLVIHHTNKLGNEPLSLSNMAGSRVLSQEADSIITLNKTPTGKRYIKPLAYRYADDSCETVQLFTRDSNQWLQSDGHEAESKILREFDNRIDDSNAEKILNYILDFTAGDNSIMIETKELVEKLVNTRHMSKPTLHKSIDKLVDGKVLSKHGRGQYTLAQVNPIIH